MIDALIVCECSGEIREAMRRRGLNAVSCDLKAAEDGSPHHIRGDAVEVIQANPSRMVIAHPPCPRLCLSGVLRLYRFGKKSGGIDPVKWAEMKVAAKFFRSIFDATDAMLCVENPRQHGYAIAEHGCGEHDQVIQPHQFGADASKATCLWLRGLPLLVRTHADDDLFCEQGPRPRFVGNLPRWSNQTDSGQNRLAPSPTRSADRARTYTGIAEAMAEQWGNFIRT